jgi:hypothetical protein
VANGSGSIVSLRKQRVHVVRPSTSTRDFLVTSSIKYLIAAVPLSSQAAALDLVAVPATIVFRPSHRMSSVYVNDGLWKIYAPIAASWLPKSFVGAVVRGPDIGAIPSFLAMGQTNSVSYDGSTLVGYMDNSTLISYASNLFENAKRAVSLLNGVVSAADFNLRRLHRCVSELDKFCRQLLVEGCSALQGTAPGRFRIQSAGLPAMFERRRSRPRLRS